MSWSSKVMFGLVLGFLAYSALRGTLPQYLSFAGL